MQRQQKPLPGVKVKMKNRTKWKTETKKKAVHHRRHRKRKHKQRSQSALVMSCWQGGDEEDPTHVPCSTGHSGRAKGIGRWQWKCISLAVDLNRLGKVVPLIVKQCSGRPSNASRQRDKSWDCDQLCLPDARIMNEELKWSRTHARHN